ncbi:hypothetical protein PHMEG_00021906 [Phytophthora megakarya]|uniref:Uncharacterized protein n=1 Tax=Phytophthora megakarya TaxID=4795 RepID=A0A225VMC6_9STRA|nr:hypothetical protein PHMEG_00021906 [Phytophthora megakarya]
MDAEGSSSKQNEPEAMDEVRLDVRLPIRRKMERGEGSRLKRARTHTEQDDGSAGLEEEGFYSSMSDEERGALEKQLHSDHFHNDRIVGGSECLSSSAIQFTTRYTDNGVQFKDYELTLRTSTRKPKDGNTKTTTYLSGQPEQFDSMLWVMLKPGFLDIEGVRVWVQPMFTGRKNTNLTLNELEYVNSNRVTFAQLRAQIQQWGATDCLVISHGTYVDQNNVRQESKRSASDCLQVTAYSTDIVYLFRLFFPSEEETNNFKVGIFGVRIEMRTTNIEELFEEYMLGFVQVEFRGAQPLFAIGTCSSRMQMDKVLEKFGPGKEAFKYKKIRLSQAVGNNSAEKW